MAVRVYSADAAQTPFESFSKYQDHIDSMQCEEALSVLKSQMDKPHGREFMHNCMQYTCNRGIDLLNKGFAKEREGEAGAGKIWTFEAARCCKVALRALNLAPHFGIDHDAELVSSYYFPLFEALEHTPWYHWITMDQDLSSNLLRYNQQPANRANEVDHKEHVPAPAPAWDPAQAQQTLQISFGHLEEGALDIQFIQEGLSPDSISKLERYLEQFKSIDKVNSQQSTQFRYTYRALELLPQHLRPKRILDLLKNIQVRHAAILEEAAKKLQSHKDGSLALAGPMGRISDAHPNIRLIQKASDKVQLAIANFPRFDNNARPNS